MKDKYGERLVDLLKHFQFITVDFGIGETIVDPMNRSCFDVNEEDVTWDIV